MSATTILSAAEFERQIKLCLTGDLQAHERILAHQAAILPSRMKETMANLVAERDAQTQRIEELERTIAILSDSDTVRALTAGMEDVKAGRLTKWEEINGEFESQRDAALQRIAELEQALTIAGHERGIALRALEDASPLAIQSARESILANMAIVGLEYKGKFAAALQRAEVAEAHHDTAQERISEIGTELHQAKNQLTACSEALSAERALEIAERIEMADGWPDYYSGVAALRAYAEAVALPEPQQHAENCDTNRMRGTVTHACNCGVCAGRERRREKP